MSRGASGHILRLMASLLLLGAAGGLEAARADETTAEVTEIAAAEPPPRAWLERWTSEPPMSGNWFGVRDALRQWGINPKLSYGTDLMASVAGGSRRGQAYAGQLTVEIDTDLEKLASLRGLSFVLSGNWASGTNLSGDIGNTFNVAQYFAGDQVRLTDMYLLQSLFDGGIELKAGRFSTSSDFLASPLDVSFVNEAANPILTAVQINVPGVTDDPNATWAGRIVTRPSPALSFSAGAYYSDPGLDQLTANGTEFGVSRDAGYFVIGEAAYLLNVENDAPGLRGRYRLGGYYDSNRYASLSKPGHQQTGNFGLYATGEQMVFREGGPGTAQGLSLFGALIYAPTASINSLPWFGAAGTSYRGLVPGRPSDTAAFALYYGGFSRYLPGQTYELVLEWTYAIMVGRRLTVQPDVQYVINPGGVSSVGNAVVLGTQIGIDF
jgi:porin